MPELVYCIGTFGVFAGSRRASAGTPTTWIYAVRQTIQIHRSEPEGSDKFRGSQSAKSTEYDGGCQQVSQPTTVRVQPRLVWRPRDLIYRIGLVYDAGLALALA